MTYDLRITISGLAMYVPEDGHTMHVLMPNADNHTSHGDSGGGGAADGGADPHAGHHRRPEETGAGASPQPDAAGSASERTWAAGEHGAEHGSDTATGDGARAVVDGQAADASAAGAAGDDAGGSGDAGATGGSGGAAGGAADGDDEDPNRHFTRIFYDRAYEDPAATELSRTYHLLDFKGKALDLRGLATGEGFEPHLPGEIPSMEGLATRVPRDLVAPVGSGPLDPRLAGRVTMNKGAVTDYLLGALFDLDGREQRITVRSEWTIRGITEEEDVPQPASAQGDAQPASGSAGAQARRPVLPAQPDLGLPALYPIGQTIRLMVFNATRDEFPPQGPGFRVGAAAEDAHHFDAYYQITPPLAARKRPIPKTVLPKDIPVTGAKVKEGRRGIQGLSCPHSMALLG